MSAFFLDMLQGLARLKMFGRGREQIDNIREISQHYGRTTMEVLGTAFQTSLVLEWHGTVATALVAVVVSLRLMSGTLPFNRVLAVLIFTPEFFLPLRQLAIRYHAGTADKAAADRILAILDTPVRLPRAQITHLTRLARSDIGFDDVDFAYDDGKRAALQGFALHLPHGQTIALVGATGACKTTAASLLLRFIEPDRGSITVAWVPQQPHLFHSTIADNIRLARADTSEADVIAAAQAAQARDFIMQLPQGYASASVKISTPSIQPRCGRSPTLLCAPCSPKSIQRRTARVIPARSTGLICPIVFTSLVRPQTVRPAATCQYEVSD